jgi:hypothetical protein
MQTNQQKLEELKTSLKAFNKNYSQAITYCALTTLGGYELARYEVEVDNSFLSIF